MFAKGNVVLIEPSGRRAVRRRGRGHRGSAGRVRPGGGHAAQGQFAHRGQPGHAPRRQRHRVRPRGLFALPSVRGGQGRAACGRSRRGGSCSTRRRPDGDLPRRAAGDVRPADRLHALVPPSGTRREAAVGLPDTHLRLDLGARAGRADPLLLRARPELGRHHRADHHPEGRHRCWQASTGACTATATPSWRAPAPTPPRTRATSTASRVTAFAATSGASAATRSAITPRPATTSTSARTTPFSTAIRSTTTTCCATASSSRASSSRNFWSLNGYYFQGLRPFDDQDTIPVALPLAETRFVSDRLRWGSYFTADSNILALTRSQGLDTRRISNSVGWTLPYRRRDRRRLPPQPQHSRRRLQYRGRSADVQLRGRREHDGPRPAAAHGRLELAARRLSGRWVHEVEPMVSVNLAPDLRQHPQDPERGQLGLRVRRDQPVRAEPLSRAGRHRHRLAGRLRPALQLLGPARDRVQRDLRPELLLHRERLHPAGIRRPGQSVGLCRRVLRAARARCST